MYGNLQTSFLQLDQASMERQSAGQLDAGPTTATQEKNMKALTDPEGMLGNEVQDMNPAMWAHVLVGLMVE
jgi:hypothetical protein